MCRLFKQMWRRICFFISKEVFLINKRSDKTELNEAIRDREVRLVGEEGEQLGIMSAHDALQLAIEKKLDLVKIAPQAVPPVCKIMDYGKHRYESQKRDKEAKKKQKQATLKEVRLSLNIEKHDMETKVNHAIKFLQEGDKVKVSLRFRGRELGNTGLGREVINKFVELVKEEGSLEKTPLLEGKSMVAIITPKN